MTEREYVNFWLAKPEQRAYFAAIAQPYDIQELAERQAARDAGQSHQRVRQCEDSARQQAREERLAQRHRNYSLCRS